MPHQRENWRQHVPTEKPDKRDDFAFDEQDSDEEEPCGWIDGDPIQMMVLLLLNTP